MHVKIASYCHHVSYRKGVPFGSFVDIAFHFWGEIPAKPQFWSMNRRFQAKRQILKVSYYRNYCIDFNQILHKVKKGKGSPYSITERRVPELILIPCSQPSGDVSHKPNGRLPLLSARPAVTLATLKRAAINFTVW